MNPDQNKHCDTQINELTVEQISSGISQEMNEIMSENMGISALLDDEISSAEFTILSAQFSANPAMMTTLKNHRYVLDALVGFGSPDYMYTERIMAYIQCSISIK